ncbi:NAD(P)-dependent oxidoreductase [Microvirga pakistanensis]|uniref:NAD(P)-dependent oxidoreductase n=1 Tax=Microvirga pakistanensis TaxID=1682650 RepID=UPI00106AECDE|nr:NAD(P)H-binding protein [Microvirga pakistanensis]
MNIIVFGASGGVGRCLVERALSEGHKVTADTRGRTDLYSTAARNIVRGMRLQRVRRLIFLSNFGVLVETATDIREVALLFLAKRVLRHTLDDHRQALDIIQEHVPEWIAVRPLPLTNGVPTRRYRIAVDGIPANGTHITRADVAHFMLRQAQRTKPICARHRRLPIERQRSSGRSPFCERKSGTSGQPLAISSSNSTVPAAMGPR